MGVVDDEWEAQVAGLRQAQHDFKKAKEGRDREFLEARQRQDRIRQEQDRIRQEQDRVRQEEREQFRREDAAEAKADALAQQQLWQQLLKAASKPVSEVPLVPDRDLAQVDAQIVQDRPVVVQDRTIVGGPSETFSRPNPNRPTQVPQGIDLAQVGILVLQTFRSRGPSKTDTVASKASELSEFQTNVVHVVLVLQRTVQVHRVRHRLQRHHRRPRRRRRPPRLPNLSGQVAATQGPPAARVFRPP